MKLIEYGIAKSIKIAVGMIAFLALYGCIAWLATRVLRPQIYRALKERYTGTNDNEEKIHQEARKLLRMCYLIGFLVFIFMGTMFLDHVLM